MSLRRTDTEISPPAPPIRRARACAPTRSVCSPSSHSGLASVAPAYSIAVTLGFVVMVVGHLAPAALLVGFVPILLTAFAFRELNREMPDCGTTFVWNTRAFGPYAGWLSGGWVVQIATVIAMTALARVGAGYLLDAAGPGLAGGQRLRGDRRRRSLILAVVTAIAYRGLQIAAEVQYVLLGLQLVALFGFGVAAFARRRSRDAEPVAGSTRWLRRLRTVRRGSAAVPVHLLGLGRADHRQRGDQDTDKTPGRAARDLHGAPAGHLPVHRVRRDQLRRHRNRRARPRQRRQRGRRAGHPRAAGARHGPGQGGRSSRSASRRSRHCSPA